MQAGRLAGWQQSKNAPNMSYLSCFSSAHDDDARMLDHRCRCRCSLCRAPFQLPLLRAFLLRFIDPSVCIHPARALSRFRRLFCCVYSVLCILYSVSRSPWPVARIPSPAAVRPASKKKKSKSTEKSRSRVGFWLGVGVGMLGEATSKEHTEGGSPRFTFHLIPCA